MDACEMGGDRVKRHGRYSGSPMCLESRILRPLTSGKSLLEDR